MNSFERFDKTKLPNKEDFYSKLNGQRICDKGYENGLQIWKEF